MLGRGLGFRDLIDRWGVTISVHPVPAESRFQVSSWHGPFAPMGKQVRIRSISKLREIPSRADRKNRLRDACAKREAETKRGMCSNVTIYFFRALNEATRLFFVDCPALERKITQASFL